MAFGRIVKGASKAAAAKKGAGAPVVGGGLIATPAPRPMPKPAPTPARPRVGGAAGQKRGSRFPMTRTKRMG